MKISSARVDAQGGRIDSATLKSYTETAVGGTGGTNSGTAYTIDLTTGNVFHILLNANCTFTFPSSLTSGTAYSFILVLKQDGGTRTATWPSSVIWPGGTAPVLSATGGIRDIFTFMTINGGTSYLGFAGGLNFAAAAAPTAYALWAWGLGTSGQLGMADIISRSVPAQVGTLTTWSAAAGGGYTTAAIKSDGTIWSWGNNDLCQIGLGDVVLRSSPVQIGGFITWGILSSGRNSAHHQIAIKTDNTLWSWGQNSAGQLGLGNVVYRSSPVQLGTLATWSSATETAIGSAAIKTDGTLWTWGANTNANLGLGDIIHRSSPVQVGTLATWSQVTGGRYQFLATKTDNTLWSWGYNTQGQLGLGDVVHRSSPVQVGGGAAWKGLAAGRIHTLALQDPSLLANSQLFSWGRNDFGQLGLADIVKRSSPVQVGALMDWSGISVGGAGQNHMAGIKINGTLWSWGLNGKGYLGLGDIIRRSSPVQVGTLVTW